MSIMFNQICINEEMLPKYTYIKLTQISLNMQKTNVMYQFKCPLGDCISDNNICWFNLNYPNKETYNARFWYKFNSSAFKKHSCPTTELRKILTDNTTILEHQNNICPVSWGCRIHWLRLCRGVRLPLMSVLDMTLNNLMVRFPQCWCFGECGVPLHCHCSQVHCGPEW